MRKLSKALPVIPLLIIVIWVAFSFWQAYQPEQQTLQGQIEAQQYSISSKVAGRIGEVLVKKGDDVVQGQKIFTLVSPELNAKLEQAKANQQAAMAMADDAKKGARQQEVDAAKDEWQKALSGAQLAEKTYFRVNNLYNDGVVSEQRRDEAYTQWQAAKYTENAAKSIYQLTLEGARENTIKAASEKERQAAGKVAEVQAYSNDMQVETKHHGEVSQVLLQSGELAPQGFPVVSIIDMQDAWLVLHIREDMLSQFKKDNEFTARIPALDNQSFTFKVTFVSVMGDFATWRATNSKKGFDLRTFEIEARPVKPIDNLRVGMSAIIDLTN